jgi:anaerobic magnesium-protoporphyrin IX monomethyl ester cyclase
MVSGGEVRAMKVLVMTGGLVSGNETSTWSVGSRLVRQWLASEHAWLDLKIKLVFAEFLLRRPRAEVHAPQTPDLTEVVLATLLQQAGMPYALATYDDLFAHPRRVRRLLEETDCVFVSTTFLRDLSELMPVVRMLKRPHNHVVVGGPLAGLLAERWGERGQDAPEVEVLAPGYGEFLVPALAEWIRSGFRTLKAPAGGRLIDRGRTKVLYSGVPPSEDLDFLPTPDWALSERDRQRRYKMIYYESVRGCPYRCSFCNYPYLFTDTRFRYKSAQRMAEEWEHYLARDEIDHIICLDSLFTVPRRRLTEFCRLLIERRLKVKWTCYARADDLAHEATAELMQSAGLNQAQIGLESGDQGQLDNMEKACTVESNGRAIDNCRKYGITSVVSLIVGFPGETAETLERTLEFLRRHPPDFFFLAPFSTRAAGVPVLNQANRSRFHLRTANHLNTGAPYWRHSTMSCAEVGGHTQRMYQRIMREGISLNAALFYEGLMNFRPEQREELLRRQRSLAQSSAIRSWVFARLHGFIDRRLATDVERQFAAQEPDATLPPELVRIQ